MRNSEDRNPAGTTGGLTGDRSKAYDPTAFGGTTTLVYDEHRRRLVQDFISLNGTTINCAGGVSYRRRYWLTGEETVGGPDASDPAARFAKRHGYLFRPRSAAARTSSSGPSRSAPPAGSRTRRPPSISAPEPSTRPRIRAPASAPASTATPKDPDHLHKGGSLHMLAIAGQPQVDLREGQTRGERLPVEWVRIDEPDPELTAVGDARSTFNQGWAKGGAKFNRLEGCWEDDGTIFFVSTSGGDAKNGDVNSDGYREGFDSWAYGPAAAAAHAHVV